MRWLILVAVSGMLLTTALEAANRGLGWLYFYPVQKSVGLPGLPASGTPLADERLAELIGTALLWDEHNPDNLRLQARVMLRLADLRKADRYYWEPVDPGVKQDYQRALDVVRQALENRPMSPWLWSDAALLKARVDGPDAIMQQYLSRAMNLGPWSPEVQVQVAETGLFRWPDLSPATQSAVINNIARGLPRMGRFVISRAQNHRKMPLLCDQPHIRKKISRYCDVKQ